jgi:hypothetical protein
MKNLESFKRTQISSAASIWGFKLKIGLQASYEARTELYHMETSTYRRVEGVVLTPIASIVLTTVR